MQTDSSKKILAISDIHIGNRNSEITQVELDWLMKNIKKLIKKESLKMIVVAGDLFDKKLVLNSEDARLAIQFVTKLKNLSRKGIYIRIIKGTLSHDLNQLENFMDFEDNKGLFRIILKAETEEIEDKKFLWIPEEYVENFDNYISPLIAGEYYDYVFGHGMFDFADKSSEKSRNSIKLKAPILKSNIWSKVADLVIFGHVHENMSHKNIHYIGSFSRNCFGEEKEKGYFMIDWNSNSIDEFIINKYAPIYKSIDLKEIIPEGTPVNEIIKKVELLKEEYDNIRIIGLPTDLANKEVFSSYFKTDENVKLNILAELQEKERDSQFDFIFDKDLSVYKKIHKYIKKKYDKDIPSKRIKAFLVTKKEEE